MLLKRSVVGLQARCAQPVDSLSFCSRQGRRSCSSHRKVAVRVAAPSEHMASSQLELSTSEAQPSTSESSAAAETSFDAQAKARKKERKREQLTYQFSAIAASSGILTVAILATYLRFSWHLRDEGDLPLSELFATLALVAGGAFGMEMYARFAHKSLWHDFEPGWSLHKSHHEPRTGPFEENDVYAAMMALPAMALCLYGFLTPTVVGGMCFGGGLGITLFGMAYVFVHDGLVHRRFPVGPIADMPYMQRLAAAHQLHHADKYEGAPWGMFLSLQELEGIPGALEEVERLVELKAATQSK